MRDTPPHIEERYHKMLMQRSGAERMLMGARMFETAKQLVLASLPPELPEQEKRVQLFLRFYGPDFSPDKRDEIIQHLRSTCLDTPNPEPRTPNHP